MPVRYKARINRRASLGKRQGGGGRVPPPFVSFAFLDDLRLVATACDMTVPSAPQLIASSS